MKETAIAEAEDTERSGNEIIDELSTKLTKVCGETWEILYECTFFKTSWMLHLIVTDC